MKLYPFKKVVFDCRQATLLALKKEERKISPAERIRLWYHLLYCDVCRRFIRQSAEMNQAGRHFHKTLSDNPSHILSPESKERMQQQVDVLNA